MTTTPTQLLETTAAALETTAAAVTDPTAATEAVLDIASIKEIMDSFDPAALLPDLSKVFGNLAAVCRFAVMIGPVVMLALGLAYLFLSPKEANYYFGYRCYYGMGSVNAWRFTQRLAGLVLSLLGGLLVVMMLWISSSFASMEVTAMVWKALDCLIWQAVAALLATLGINGAAAFFFDRKGELRRKPNRSSQTKKPQ